MVVTSRLDNDDGLHRDFIRLVQQQVRVGTVEALVSSVGIVLADDVPFVSEQGSNAFISLSEPLEGMRTVLVMRHKEMGRRYTIRTIRVRAGLAADGARLQRFKQGQGLADFAMTSLAPSRHFRGNCRRTRFASGDHIGQCDARDGSVRARRGRGRLETSSGGRREVTAPGPFAPPAACSAEGRGGRLASPSFWPQRSAKQFTSPDLVHAGRFAPSPFVLDHLVTPPLTAATAPAFARVFAEVLAAAPIASVLVRLGDRRRRRGEGDRGPAPQGGGVRRLRLDSGRRPPPRRARLGADGAHVEGVGEALDEALESLKPERIVGVGALRMRDDAMSAGEKGADYVMFGEPRGAIPPMALELLLERVGWWAEISKRPASLTPSRSRPRAASPRAGADFVAVEDAIWSAPSPADAARALHAALSSAAAEAS